MEEEPQQKSGAEHQETDQQCAVVACLQDPDHEEVVQDRCEHRQRESAPGVEHGGREGSEAVEQDLGRKHTEQGSGHRLLVGGRRALEAEAVEADDGGGDGHEQHRHPHQQDDGSRHHGGDGLPGLVLVPVAQVVDEDGDDERRHDPAEDEVVDDVRRGVGQVVAVGHAGESECVGEGHQPTEAGDAREERAHRHPRRRP